MTREEEQVLELLMAIMQGLNSDKVCDGFVEIKIKEGSCAH